MTALPPTLTFNRASPFDAAGVARQGSGITRGRSITVSTAPPTINVGLAGDHYGRLYSVASSEQTSAHALIAFLRANEIEPDVRREKPRAIEYIAEVAIKPEDTQRLIALADPAPALG